MLPGVPQGIQFRATRDWAWRQYCVPEESEIRAGDGVSARESFARAVGIRKICSLLAIPLECRIFDVSYVRDADTTEYARALREFIRKDGTGNKRATWKGRFVVSAVALLVPRPLLPPGYRAERRFGYHDRRGLETERRARSILGVIVPS